MAVISRPLKSNNLHNDLTSLAKQMLVFLAPSGLTSVQLLSNETLHHSLVLLAVVLMKRCIH